MTKTQVTARALVARAVGGGWGRDAPDDGLTEVAIIRGADFPAVAVGDSTTLPVRWEEERKVPQRILRPGDIVLEISGGTNERPTGRTVFITERLLQSIGRPAIAASFCRLVRINPDLADPYYVYWWLQGMYADGRTWAYQNRSTGIANFQFEHFLDTEMITLPPREEQRSIAATLGAINEKIACNGRAIELGLSLLDAFSERAGDLLPTVALSDLTSLNRTTTNPAALKDAPVDHFSLPAFDASARPEVVPAASIMSNKTSISRRAILVSRLNPRINRTWWVTPRDGYAALASTEFACLTAADDVDLAGLWLAVRAPCFREELPRRVTGTSGSHQRVRPHDLLTIKVPNIGALSDRAKRDALSLLLMIDHLRDESARLATLREALLPELLSGCIRVPEAHESEEALT